jgi:hypothetical protein
MKKKFYLKPELEVLEIETEFILAGTLGDGSDEYEIDTDTPPVDAGGIN